MADQPMRSTWSVGGGASSSSSSTAMVRAPSSSSTAVARAPTLPAAFPPALAEVEDLLAEDIDLGEKWKCLSRWCDAMLELVSEAMRGSHAEAPPLEEVWHWLAASERLARGLAFAEHRAVAELLKRAAEDGGQEGGHVNTRWQTATRQLRQAQKESGWNAEYLRVVEEPLGRLASDDVLRSGALAKVVKTLLRSLHHIYCTSAYFKEHRMAALLLRVLKSLVGRAASSLAAPREAAAPPGGLGAALRAAGLLRDAFQAFADHYFISEVAAGAAAKTDRRPATALGTKGDRTMVSSTALKRKDTAELGLWRATVRHSLEHAEHCRLTCGRMASILTGCARLRASLRAAAPELRRAVESFLELHGGLASGLGAADLLDLRHRVAAGVQLREMEDRLQELLAAAEAAGVLADEDAALEAADGAEPRLLDSAGGGAEVLTLPGGEAGAAFSSAEEVQRSIESIRDELRSFEEQLQGLNEAISRKAPAQGGRPPFRPPSRGGGGCRGASGGAAASGDEPGDDAADRAAALEVAKRSSWYREPPPLLPSDVPLIEVHQSIAQRTIHRCPSRPRTAQPVLFIMHAPEATRAAEEGPAESPSPEGPDTPPEDDGGARAAEVSGGEAPEEPPKEPGALDGSPAEDEGGEVSVTSPAVGEVEDEDGEAFDPLETSGVSWQIA